MGKSKGKWIMRIDGILLRLLMVLIPTLLLSQLLLLKEEARPYLSKVDRMEGEDLASTIPLYADIPLQITEETTVLKSYQNLLRRRKTIMIKMITPSTASNAFLIVNGKRVDDFHKGECKLIIYDGDYVEIDARALTKPVQFVVNTSDQGVLFPKNGLILDGVSQSFIIGKIKFKSE